MIHLYQSTDSTPYLNSVSCMCEARMLLLILVLNLLSLTDAGRTDAKSSPKQGLEDMENLVEKLVKSRLREMETRMQEKLELRLEELDLKMKHKAEEQAKEKKGARPRLWRLHLFQSWILSSLLLCPWTWWS